MTEKPPIEPDTSDELFISQAKTQFAQSVQNLDGATQSRLNQVRQKALAEIAVDRGFGRWNQWLPVVGVAAAAVFAVVLWRGSPPQEPPVPAPTVADFELLLDQEQFEMLEDLEFYSWIDIADDAAANVG